jgi:glycosyltransferase involved in cell wall biosynthesis
MKVVFVRHSLLSRGGDKMILAHAAHLAATGHEVTIKSAIIDTVFQLDERIKFQIIDSRSKLQTIIKCLAETHDSDWVIADIIPLACLLFLRNRGKVLYFAQDYDESYYSKALQKYFVRALYVLGLSWLKIPVIAVSHDLKETLSRRFNAKVSVVTNGVDLETFFPDPAADLLKQKNDRKSILVLSRSDWRKGFDLAQRVIKKVKEETIGPFEVWTVGESASGCFEGMIHKDFGYVREEELRKIISSADIFLYPTRHEGFGLMVAEAFACGCPVITTTAVPFVEDGKNALVSQVEDVDAMTEKLLRLLSEPEVGKPLVSEGTAFARQHSLVSACRQFAAILEERHVLR